MEKRSTETEPQGSSEMAEQGLDGRLRRLTEIVETLEADEVELDRALSLFEEGIGHVQQAERLLAEAELKVEELVRRAGGVETRPFDSENE